MMRSSNPSHSAYQGKSRGRRHYGGGGNASCWVTFRLADGDGSWIPAFAGIANGLSATQGYENESMKTGYFTAMTIRGLCLVLG